MATRTMADALSDRIRASANFMQDALALETAVSETFLSGESAAQIDDELVDRLLRNVSTKNARGAF